LLIAAAVAFCWPVLRTASKARQGADLHLPTDEELRAERNDWNSALYEDYALELAADKTLDAQTRDALLADKARQLLDDARGSESAVSQTAQDRRSAQRSAGARTARAMGLSLPARIVVLALLVAGSVTLYLNLGTPDADALVAARDILQLPSLGELDAREDKSDNQRDETRLRQLTGSLRSRVGDDSEDAGSRYLLGIGELKLGAYAEAADAFASAHALVGDDANLDLYWLQARLLADEGKLSPVTRTIAARVLATRPNQPMVLNMLALAAFRSNDFAAAVGYLNSALSNNLTAGQRDLLREGFAQARSSLGVAGPTVDVQLTLEGTPPSQAMVFVIARPVGGGMPFAAVRRPADGLPPQIRLDDAVSMNPANPLSAAAQVEVVARLSLTGRPEARPGDWEWRSEPLALADLANGVPVQLEAVLAPPG